MKSKDNFIKILHKKPDRFFIYESVLAISPSTLSLVKM
jgi:hypothetical protein